MSPESYVLLLISCWLLLASALLWGMLRIARRHYPVEENHEQAVEPESAEPLVTGRSQCPLRKPRELPQMTPGLFTRTFDPSRRARC